MKRERIWSFLQGKMWLAGMQEPDFRAISDFRKARIDDIKELFQQMLATCVELEMVRCRKISLDGTRIEANGGKTSLPSARPCGSTQLVAKLAVETQELLVQKRRKVGSCI